MISSVSNKQLGIGKWSAVPNEVLGRIVEFPATSTQGARRYMYVKFVKDSGVDAYQGSPCGFAKTVVTDTARHVTCDVSESPSTTPCGIIVNSSTTAVTDDYYGWIQLAVPGQVLKTVLLTSGIANNDLVVWENDRNFEAATAFTSLVDVIDVPFGIVCTGITQGATSTLVSTTTTGDVLVLLNPYVT